jgi:hypothetical protein
MAAVTCASLAASLSLAADTAADSCWLLGSSVAAAVCAVAAGVSHSEAAAALSSDSVMVGVRAWCELTCAAEAAVLVSLSAAAELEADSTLPTVLDLSGR